MHGHIPKPAPIKLGSPMTAEERKAAQSLKEALEAVTVWEMPTEGVIRVDGDLDALAGQFTASE